MAAERWAAPRTSGLQKAEELKQAKVAAVDAHAAQHARAEKVKTLLKTTFGSTDSNKPAAWILTPGGVLRERIRLAGTLCAVYTLFAEPFFVAFDVRPIGDAALVLCSLADAVLALDLVVSFVTGYHWLAADGVFKVETRTLRCVVKYLRTNFLRDFLGALPLQLALRIVDPAGRMQQPGPAFIRVLELGKCVLLLRVREHVGAIESSRATSTPLLSSRSAGATASAMGRPNLSSVRKKFEPWCTGAAMVAARITRNQQARARCQPRKAPGRRRSRIDTRKQRTVQQSHLLRSCERQQRVFIRCCCLS